MHTLDYDFMLAENEVLVPSSQRYSTSSDKPNSAKRRRLNTTSQRSRSESTEGTNEYDLPTNNTSGADDGDGLERSKSRYETYTHVPVRVESQRDEFYTQIQQPGSSPSAIRGPRWQKKRSSPPPGIQVTASVLTPRPAPTVNASAVTPGQSISTVQDEFDDDDAQLLEALAVSGDLENISTTPVPTNNHQLHSDKPNKSYRQTTLFGINTTQRQSTQASQARVHSWPVMGRSETPTHHKLDVAAMRTWIYPLNVGSIRDYQFNIVHRALFHNLLVALPTGLGKTFIAATVMLNYFRWTKDAQMIFVAPTKPLVTQQVDACFNIAGIPRSSTTLLTGEVTPAVRAEEWADKRVFFMTPQTLINDLKTGMADPKRIVLLVVDEAHKATGNYAYVEVVKFLRRFNNSFRVLALTATPGATVEAVQKVIDGLDIARVEIRTEESMDIQSFVHTRDTELQLFDNSDELETCLELFASAVKPVLEKVAQLNAYYSSDPRSMTLFGLMKGREKWAQSEAGRRANWGLKGMINACLNVLMGLAHNLELLKFHGIGPFYHKMKAFQDGEAGDGKYVKQIKDSESFQKLMSMMRAWINDDDFVGHPKLVYLNEVVLNHFMDAGNGVGIAGSRPPSDTRIMIFAHYRDSAEEITRILNRHKPLIRAHIFVGQSSRKGSEGMDQKTQIDIIKKFKAGVYNTLIATSIGEEGLDIGEVDLIVCYDCSKSPIRMLQRMGRTGRKRAGKIVLLLMRGKEERDYHAAKDNYLKMQGIIERGTEFAFHDDRSTRIMPREMQPVVDKRIVDIPVENTQCASIEPRRRKSKATKRPPKRFNMPDGVETGFTFLGGGKDKKTNKQKESRTKVTADSEHADLPRLESVTLTAKEEEELDHRYAQVAGSQTVYVQQIRLDTQPQQIHRLCKTRIVQHSACTRALVHASQRMRAVDRDWNRPSDRDILHDYGVAYTLSTPQTQVTNGAQMSRKNNKAYAVRSSSKPVDASPQSTSGNLAVNEDEYDANDSFLDDEPDNAVDILSSSSPELLPRQDRSFAKDTKFDVPFYVSQQSIGDNESDVDELPDMSTIFGKPKNVHRQPMPRGATKLLDTARRRPMRRVIEEDDSDE